MLSQKLVLMLLSSPVFPLSLSTSRYELIIIQEPFTGCAFGSDTLARIPCEPPLVLNLRAYDEEAECYVPL